MTFQESQRKKWKKRHIQYYPVLFHFKYNEPKIAVFLLGSTTTFEAAKKLFSLSNISVVAALESVWRHFFKVLE